MHVGKCGHTERHLFVIEAVKVRVQSSINIRSKVRTMESAECAEELDIEDVNKLAIKLTLMYGAHG
jgi:hypothetical protein